MLMNFNIYCEAITLKHKHNSRAPQTLGMALTSGKSVQKAPHDSFAGFGLNVFVTLLVFIFFPHHTWPVSHSSKRSIASHQSAEMISSLKILVKFEYSKPWNEDEKKKYNSLLFFFFQGFQLLVPGVSVHSVQHYVVAVVSTAAVYFFQTPRAVGKKLVNPGF